MLQSCLRKMARAGSAFGSNLPVERKNMEYYAKSKKRKLSEEEKEIIKIKLQCFLLNYSDLLSEKEKRIVNNGIEKLNIEAEGEKQKRLKEHQDDIVKCAEMFFLQYGAYFTEKEKNLVIEACRIHDLGKANLLFQMVVQPKLKMIFKDDKNESQIPHGFLSAISISEEEFLEWSELFEKEDFSPFITAVYYHHDREDNYESGEIRKYCKKYYQPYLEEYCGREQTKIYCRNKNRLLFRNVSNKSKFEVAPEIWNEYLVVKGLLNKFDYAVSAEYAEAECVPDLQDKKLKKNIEQVFSGKELRPAQKYMKDHKNDNVVVIAPTGSGKTEAALLWLDGEKGFYTLPLKVSSNAIYDRIKKKYFYEDVALLHSDSMSKYMSEETEDIQERYIRSRMLAQPLTVCTVDQLFKFVYRALGTEVFAATLKYSKIVLDEIQSYSPQVIATIIYGLKMIQDLGGKFAVITATFPPVLSHFMSLYGLSDGKEYQFVDFSKSSINDEESLRHWIKIRKTEIDIDEILEQGEEKKVLVICNTVRRAQEIYYELYKRNAEVHTLHSRFVRKDREILEEKIKEFSEPPEDTGIWVTTQIVEASLDIDFDILHTEMCSVDSLLQRLGRCNRKGRYIPEKANIIVYDNRNGVGSRAVYEEEIYNRSIKCLKKYENMLFTEEMKTAYINEVYDIDAIKGTKYYMEIEKYLKLFKEIRPTEYKKIAVDKEFRNIESITVIPDSIYDSNQGFLEDGIEVLKTAYIGPEVKNIIRTKITDLTLGMPIYSARLYAVDRGCIGQSGTKRILDIHRIPSQYEFDVENFSGRGLILEKKEDEAIFV